MVADVGKRNAATGEGRASWAARCSEVRASESIGWWMGSVRETVRVSGRQAEPSGEVWSVRGERLFMRIRSPFEWIGLGFYRPWLTQLAAFESRVNQSADFALARSPIQVATVCAGRGSLDSSPDFPELKLGRLRR